MNNQANKNETEKMKRLLTLFSVIQPIITVIGIAVLIVFRGIWYWMAFFALILCYAAFGTKSSDIADGYAKLRYPTLYNAKGRPSNGRIKAAAREQGDEVTIALKNSQRTMFIICVVCILVFALCIAAVM